MKTLRFLETYKLFEQDIPAGKFANVDDDAVAQKLVDAGIAVAQTEAQYETEKRSKALEALTADLDKRKADRAIAGIKVIGQQDDPRGGFKSFSHFCYDVYKSGQQGQNLSEHMAKWLRKAAGSDEMRGDVGTAGGFLIPTEFAANLLRNTLEATIVRQRATVIPMATTSITMPYINETSHASTLFGGVAAAHRMPTQQMTATKPTIGKLTLNLHELYAFAFVDNSMLEDSPISLEPILNATFSQTIAWQEDYEYLQGTGAGQALGVINAPCLNSVSKETGQLATTIVAENILKMWAGLMPTSQANAVWVASTNTFPQLATMSLKVGTGGVPVWMPAQGVAGAPNGTLMGRPLILTEKLPTLGTVGDIMLCDFSQYLVGAKGGIQSAQSVHLRFDYDESAFRLKIRCDGQPWHSSTLTLKNTAVVSPFVALETRS